MGHPGARVVVQWAGGEGGVRGVRREFCMAARDAQPRARAHAQWAEVWRWSYVTSESTKSQIVSRAGAFFGGRDCSTAATMEVLSMTTTSMNAITTYLYYKF